VEKGMKFYFALIEIAEDKLDETSGNRFVKAMKELKESCNGFGKCTYHEVSKESEYRRIERELKR
jgi:hypothetical protein